MSREAVTIDERQISKVLFGNSRLGWLGLPLCLYLGWMWWDAGWHKLVDPRWMGVGKAILESKSLAE